METEIRFLRELEGDLESVARVRAVAELPSTTRKRRRRGTWIGAAAALIAGSFVVGTIMQSGVKETAVNEGAASFSSVASAVGAPGGTVPAPQRSFGYARSGDALTGFDPQSGLTDSEKSANLSGTGDKSASEQGAPAADLSKIIKDGDVAVTIETGSFRDRSAEVFGIARSNGGSVLSSTTSESTSGTFTLRVPAKNFERAMVQLGKLGSLDSSAVRGQDVTAEYIDQKAHLQIYLSHRKFLYGLLADATTTGQALALENQLQQVQLRIDQITGQLRYLNNQVAESTIRVDLHEPGASGQTSGTDVDNPSLGDAFSRAIQGFLRVVSVIVIGFGYLIPLLVIAAAAFGIYRLVQRRRAAYDTRAPASRSQPSARDRSALIDARVRSSPSAPSVAPNHVSASRHAASMSPGSRRRADERNTDTEPDCSIAAFSSSTSNSSLIGGSFGTARSAHSSTPSASLRHMPSAIASGGQAAVSASNSVRSVSVRASRSDSRSSQRSVSRRAPSAWRRRTRSFDSSTMASIVARRTRAYSTSARSAAWRPDGRSLTSPAAPRGPARA
jgi:hypothetical protein